MDKETVSQYMQACEAWSDAKEALRRHSCIANADAENRAFHVMQGIEGEIRQAREDRKANKAAEAAQTKGEQGE